jgi:hypothetical protein
METEQRLGSGLHAVSKFTSASDTNAAKTNKGPSRPEEMIAVHEGDHWTTSC